MTRAPIWLRRFAALSWRERGILFEATAAIVLASVAIAVLPFRIVVRSAAWPRRRPPVGPHARSAIRERVRWAVTASARRIPWRAVCFQQGLATQWMLRRRGIPSTLHYGAA